MLIVLATTKGWEIVCLKPIGMLSPRKPNLLMLSRQIDVAPLRIALRTVSSTIPLFLNLSVNFFAVLS